MAEDLFDVLSKVDLARKLSDEDQLLHVCLLIDIAKAGVSYRNACEATGLGAFATVTETRLALFDLLDKWEEVNG